MAAVETEGKRVQQAVVTKAAARRDTEKTGTDYKARKRETGEVPIAEGKASAAEEMIPAAGRNTSAAETPGSAKSGTDKTTGSEEAINQRFVRFLQKHHVLTLATVSEEGMPYCSNAFYCYDKARNLLVFTSDLSTRHAQQMERNPHVAASVVLETKIVGRVQGLQLCGTAVRADEAAKRAYLKRFPYAALAELTLWAIEPDFMKLTDNTLGFGKKLIWNNK